MFATLIKNKTKLILTAQTQWDIDRLEELFKQVPLNQRKIEDK